MEKMNVLGAILLSILLIGGCHKNKNAMVISHGESDTIAIDNASANGNLKSGLIKVDVTKKYPLKEIRLQDIADVEYVPLETNDKFLCNGRIQYMGNDFIIFQNFDDGNIFVFNAEGKALNQINHKGNGPEEYSGITNIGYDSNKEEVYVNNMWTKRIYVYGQTGIFQRSFPHSFQKHITKITDFNKSELLCEAAKDSFLLISKRDGHKIMSLPIFYRKKMELGYAERYEGGVKFLTTYVPSLISCGNDYIINEISADTIYRFTQDHKLVPLLTRKPPAGEPETFVALLVLLETNRYLFIQTIKNEYNLKTLEGFPCTELMYDKVEGEIYEYKIYSDDYAEREVVWGRGEKQYIKEENKIYQYLKAPDLVKAYQEGKLKGRLSELASQLNEEDNGIVMLIHFK